MMKKTPEYIDKPKTEEKEVSSRQLNRRNFIAFGVYAGLYAAAYGGWKWLYHAPLEQKGITGNTRRPLRKALNRNELFFRRVFNRNHLAKTYPINRAVKVVRQNGDIGLDTGFDPSAWKLNIKKQNGETLAVTYNDLLKLHKTEIIYDFKCVEGWDQIQHWGGVKFSDFIDHFGLQEETKAEYVGFVTPDKQYYVGIDMPSAMHPQTILAYEMNGKPMPLPHGFPLRLIIPVKYGIKNLKRIDTISFSNQRPPDYWAEQGYDYYSGL